MGKKRKSLRVVSAAIVCAMTTTSVLPAAAAKKSEEKLSEVKVEQTDCSNNPNAYAIYPLPQKVTYPQKAETFTLHQDGVAIVSEDGVDQATKDFVKKILDKYKVGYTESKKVDEQKTNIILGVQATDGVADDYMKENQISEPDAKFYEKSDAYVLNADAEKKNIVIEGKDTDATFHGVATLQMMFSSFSGKKFLDAQIEDYATVETRGYIEGFYGAWNFAERADLMEFAKNYKMNSYVYAAKGDEYHTGKWAQLYPEETIKEFEKLVKKAEETKVDFVWSVHLGNFFKSFSSTSDANYETQYQKLMTKLNQLYEIGVRKFDVLNDDFGGGNNDMVVSVLNRLNADLKAKGCDSLTYCPQGYNKAWSGNGAELAALKKLDSDIHIYWTGDDVNSPVTQETVNFLKEKSDHDPDFWLNYPVNEHAKSGIYLGDITYYARDGVTGLAGFHSNPSRFAYANEVGLYQLAALVWNNNDYSKHANEIWESAFHYLQPEVKDAYLTIARNVSNAPDSSRVPGFNESEYLKEKLDAVQKLAAAGKPLKANEDAKAVLAEFENMILAVKTFRETCENKALVKELEPWLKSLDDVAHAGKEALESLIALEEKDATTAWTKLSSASKYYDTMYTYLTAEDLPNVYAKAGSRRLAPFVSKVISAAKNQLTPIVNPGDTTISPTLYAKMGGAEVVESADSKKMYDGDETTYATWQVKQQVGDYYGLDLGRVTTVTDISILQGQKDGHHDIFHDAELQYSEDGETWTKIDAKVDGDRVVADGLNVKARYVRYYLKTTGYNGKPDYWTYVREFTVNKKVEEHDRVYTNVESLKKTPLTLDGTEISIRNLKGVTLKPDDYVGIKLEKPEAAKAFVKEVSTEEGLAFEYSFDALNWTDVKTAKDLVGVKYLRLRNSSDHNVTMDIVKFGMDIKSLQPEAKLLQSTIKNGLSEGSYTNVFDDNLSSYILTKENPAKDSYMTFDLGKTIEVYDVEAVTSDGLQRLYHAKIQISENNRDWTDVAIVENDNSVMEVPYRYVRGNGNGKKARYLRLYFTENGKNKLKLHEIQINKKTEGGVAAAQIISNMSGNIGAVIDNDISTLFSQKTKSGDYIKYRVTENTNITQISVLQGKAGDGELYVTTPEGEKKVGSLKDVIAKFDTKDLGAISEICIKWTKESEAAIHELAIATGESQSDDIGEFVTPIIVDDGEESDQNLAIGKNVVVSGTSDGEKDNVNDADTGSKWDSDFIKGPNAKENAWIYIDLGEEKEYLINQIVVHFFNKIYPTKWQLQTSNDAQNWETVKELSKAPNGAAHPVETINLETPLTARYVRLFFEELNSGAAGNGVGITEFEIYGKEKKDEAADKTALYEAIKDAEGKTESKKYTKASRESLKAALAEARKVAENANAAQEQVTNATANLQEAVKALQVKVTERQNIGLKKPVTVSGTSNGVKESINDGDETTKWDSDLIKSGTGNTAQDIGDAWFVVDLGEQANLIDGLKVSYFNKVYPTDYEVQVSNDNQNWTTVKTLKKEHNGATHPKDDVQFETPVSARYVRMFFKELNNVAAGHGVGINEAEVLGRYVYENASVQSVSVNADILVQKDSVFDMSQLPAVNGIQITVEEMAETMQALVPVTWNTDNLDMSKADTYKLEGVLSLSGIANADNKKANVNVVVQGEETEELKYAALDEQLAIAEKIEKDKDKYTEESYDKFKAAYESGKSARQNAAEQNVIDAATERLQQAIASLQEKPTEPENPEVDKSGLQAKVDEYSKVSSEQYTEESWNAFEKVLEDAKAVLKDEKATQDAIDAMLVQLNTVYESLEKAEIPQPQPEADKTVLQQTVEQYEKLNEDAYTKESWSAFEKALEEAKAVLQDENVTQQDVDKALEVLRAAYEGLEGVTAEPTPPTDPSKPTEPSKPTKPTTPPTTGKPNEEKPNHQKPAKTGDPAGVFGIFTSMILAGGYIFGRRKKDDK